MRPLKTAYAIWCLAISVPLAGIAVVAIPLVGFAAPGNPKITATMTEPAAGDLAKALGVDSWCYHLRFDNDRRNPVVLSDLRRRWDGSWKREDLVDGIPIFDRTRASREIDIAFFIPDTPGRKNYALRVGSTFQRGTFKKSPDLKGMVARPTTPLFDRRLLAPGVLSGEGPGRHHGPGGEHAPARRPAHRDRGLSDRHHETSGGAMAEAYNPIMRTFCQFRVGVLNYIDIDRHDIRPGTPLESLLPAPSRRAVWEHLRRQGLRPPPLAFSRRDLQGMAWAMLRGVVSAGFSLQRWSALFAAIPLIVIIYGGYRWTGRGVAPRREERRGTGDLHDVLR